MASLTKSLTKAGSEGTSTTLTAKAKGANGTSPHVYLPTPKGRSPSSMWDKATLNDIGEGYQIIQEIPVLEEYEFYNPFLRGSSDFIFFVVKPKFKAKVNKKIVAPINLNNKLSPQNKKKIAKKIGINIDDFAAFFMEDILPVSLSITSAGKKVDEMMQQLIDDKANLPMAFIQAKASQAVGIRIIRRICEKFSLTKAEQAMMFREYTHDNSVFKIKA